MNEQVKQIADTKVALIKNELEWAIQNHTLYADEFVKPENRHKITNGLKAKESFIRSSKLINHIHELAKEVLVLYGLNQNQIKPPLNASKPELGVYGFLKKKNQDVSYIPKNIKPSKREVDWGPLSFGNHKDPYGDKFISNSLIINIRSQLSSIGKNNDTLFERTFAEALNLHMIYPELTMGEIYLIPVYEYDEQDMINGNISFKTNKTKVEDFIAFFSAINNRDLSKGEHYKYERCALMIVDFSRAVPKIYYNTQDLIDDNLVSQAFPLELADISIDTFFEDIISIYNSRVKKNLLFGVGLNRYSRRSVKIKIDSF